MVNHYTLGTLVVPVGIPPGLEGDSRLIFQRALGSALRIDELQLIDDGPATLLGLNVDERGQQADWAAETIYLEPAWVRPASLLEIFAHLPNGLHDVVFEHIDETDDFIRIRGSAWVGDLDRTSPAEREARRPVELTLIRPTFISCSGCARGELEALQGGTGDVFGLDPITLFCGDTNSICWLRCASCLVTLPLEDTSRGQPR